MGPFSDRKTDVGTVVEGVVALNEGLRGLERTDVEGIGVALLLEALFAGFERGAEEGVAVGGEDNLEGFEAEGDDGHLGLGDGEAVDNGVGDVLIVHDLEHVWNHDFAGGVGLLQQVAGLHAFGEQLADALGTHLGQLLFVGLGIVAVLAVKQTMTVAHKPHFATQAAEDDD